MLVINYILPMEYSGGIGKRCKFLLATHESNKETNSRIFLLSKVQKLQSVTYLDDAKGVCPEDIIQSSESSR